MNVVFLCACVCVCLCLCPVMVVRFGSNVSMAMNVMALFKRPAGGTNGMG